MTILVTGSSGFVGLNVLESLLSTGQTVVGFSMAPPPQIFEERLRKLPGELRLVAGDVVDRGALEAALNTHKATSLVHLAAVTAATHRERVQAGKILEVNLGGLAAALDACSAAQVKRFIYVSSIAVFGPNTADGAQLDEDAQHDPQTLYAITKSAGEAVAARLGTLFALDWTIARLGRVFGPYEHETGARDTMSQIYQVMQCARDGRVARFDRPCFKNWSYARDVGEDLAMLADATSTPHRIYNLGSPYVWSLEDWCGRLASLRPDFHFTVGAGSSPTGSAERLVDLMGERDGSILSWTRFLTDFPGRERRDLNAAFDDYLRFLDQQMKSSPP